jgi:hypothetical protein
MIDIAEEARMEDSSLDIRNRILGAWTLVECVELHSDGSRTYPLGDDATGQLLYTPDGHVAAQLCSGSRQNFASNDWREAGTEEAARAFREYFGYFGTFSIDVSRELIAHHVEASLFPNLTGGDQLRHYRFEEERLILDADTAWGQIRIVWRRPGETARA